MSEAQITRERIIKTGKSLILVLFLAVGALVIFIPFLWMVLSTFKLTSEINAFNPSFFPKDPTLFNYRSVFQNFGMGRYYLNSVFVASTITVSALFFSSIAGYIFAKYSFRGKELLFVLILSTMMIPFSAIMVPLNKLVVDFRLTDTYLGLLLIDLVSTLGIFLMRQFIHAIPSDVFDAARMDGCSQFRIYWSMVLPLSKPALAVLAILSFKNGWNAFLWPLIVIGTDESKWTLTLAIANFVTHPDFQYDYGGIMAATLITIIPLFVVFLIAQKRIIRGISLTGLKG